MINCGIFIKNINDNIKQQVITKDSYTISFIGNCNTGAKTSLIKAYNSEKGYDGILVPNLGNIPYIKKIQSLNGEFKLILFDNCGQEKMLF